MPEEEQEWRVERYLDETDPFASLSWFVMRGNAVIAQCEVEAHAERILLEHQHYEVFARALTEIAALSHEHGLAAAREAAQRALDQNV
jgi:hypothetical protein